MNPNRARLVLIALIAFAMVWGLLLLVAPESRPQACKTNSGAVVVNLNNDRSPAAVSHVRRAIRAGQPWFLHIDRVHEDVHRRASLRGIPKVAGHDLDEYPPAVAAEGGAGADVDPILPSDNRSAGATMGNALRGYCDGQAFVFRP